MKETFNDSGRDNGLDSGCLRVCVSLLENWQGTGTSSCRSNDTMAAPAQRKILHLHEGGTRRPYLPRVHKRLCQERQSILQRCEDI